MTTDSPQPEALPSGKDLTLPESEKPKYLLFHEAVCWIAFHQYDFPPLGPRNYLEFMLGDSAFEDEGTQDQGKFELAQEQLITAIENGLVGLAGRYEHVWETGHSKESQNSESFRVKMHPISREAVASSDFYEDGGQYFVGNQWYDILVVPVKELQATFGGFIRSEKGSDNLASVTTITAMSEIELKAVREKRKGRPPEWDWNALTFELFALANTPDGLPDKQANLERWVAEYFQRKHGSEPSVSSIRSKLSPIYQRLRQKSQ